MVDEAEIERIREQKLKEMAERQQAEQQRAQAITQLEAILRPLLTPDAWSQWSTARMNNENNALAAGEAIVQLSQSGKIQGKVGVEQVKSLLRLINQRTRMEWKIQRR